MMGAHLWQQILATQDPAERQRLASQLSQRYAEVGYDQPLNLTDQERATLRPTQTVSALARQSPYANEAKISPGTVLSGQLQDPANPGQWKNPNDVVAAGRAWMQRQHPAIQARYAESPNIFERTFPGWGQPVPNDLNPWTTGDERRPYDPNKPEPSPGELYKTMPYRPGSKRVTPEEVMLLMSARRDLFATRGRARRRRHSMRRQQVAEVLDALRQGGLLGDYA